MRTISARRSNHQSIGLKPLLTHDFPVAMPRFFIGLLSSLGYQELLLTLNEEVRLKNLG
jgi:hypothetical protein